MATRWTEARITQLQREGRGQGEGKAYSPWTHVQDFSSLGKSRRVFCPKVGRVVHLLSDIEYGLFLLLEHLPHVVDLREQFPLDRNGTQSIAAELGIAHPTYPATQIPVVMTVDFLVTTEVAGKRSMHVLTCKPDAELEKPRVLEKLNIERQYFVRQQIRYFPVVETQLPRTKIKNLEWIRNAPLTQGKSNLDDAAEWHQRFAHDLRQTRQSGSLQQFCLFFDSQTGALPGTGLRIVRSLLWEGTIQTDLNEPNLVDAPLSLFRVVDAKDSLGLGV